MAQEDRIIIEVEVNAGESAQQLADVRTKIDAVKKAQKDMTATRKELNDAVRAGLPLTQQQQQQLVNINSAMATNQAELKQLTAQEKVYTAQIQIATQNDRKFGDSITELGAQLAQLKQEYRSLSAAQRESAEGKEMLKQIQELDEQVKQADYSMGDFQRNVGNYSSALLGLNGNASKVAAMFAGGLKNGVIAAGNSLKAFSKTLLATPVGQISAAIRVLVTVFNLLRDAFKRNDDAGTTLSASLARLSPIVTAVKEGFVALATGIANVVNWVTKAATSVIGFLVPSFKQAADAASELVIGQDKLEDRRRKFSTDEVEREKTMAELRKKAMSDEKLTAKEREEIYKEIDELSRQNMEERKAIAEENYRQLEQEAKRDADTRDKMKDKLQEAYNDMIKAQTEYLTETTRISSRQRQAREEQEKEAEAQRQAARQAAQQAAQERKARLKAQEDELRALEDLQIEAIKDEAQRARAEMQTAYNRRIEDLKKRLEEEKDLTVKAREAINAQIALLERQQAERLAQLDNERIEEQRKRANEIAAATVDARIAAIENATEREIEAEKVAAERKTAALKQRLEEEKDLTVEERANIEEQIAIATAESEKKIAEITANARAEAVKKSFCRDVGGTGQRARQKLAEGRRERRAGRQRRDRGGAEGARPAARA